MKTTIRNRLILSLILLLALGVFLIDQTALQGVVLPGPPYFVWILIAAYFLSPRATAGVAVFTTLLKLIADWTEGTPLWLTGGYISAGVIVGIGSIVLANKMRQEEALSAEKERLRAEAAQRAAELEFERARWQATVDNMLDLVTTCDTRGSVTYINPAYTRLIERFVRPGLPLEEHPSFYQIFHPDGTMFKAEELPLQKAALLNREVQDIELVHRTTDSREFICVFSASPLHDDTGRVVGAVAVGHDVTAERKAEAERERLHREVDSQRQLLQTVNTSSPVAIAVLRGSNFVFELVNPVYQAFAPGKEFVGKSVAEAWREIADQVVPLLEKVLRTGEPFQASDLPLQIARKAGGPMEEAYFTFSYVLLPAMEGGEPGILVEAMETTEQVSVRRKIQELAAVAEKRAQEREERLAKLRSLIQVSEEVLAETTVQGLLQRVVDAACTLTRARIAIIGHGYEKGIFRIGATSSAQVDLPCPPGEEFQVQQGGVYLDLINQVHSLRLTQEELQRHPAWRGLPKGHRALHGLLGARLVGRDGKAAGLIMLTKSGERDDEFSEEDEALLAQLAALASLGLQHVEARNEAERQRNELDVANQELESFAYSVSHDLRAPLRHIDGFSEALMEDFADSLDETGKQYLGFIRESTQTMGQLIGDLLELSRVTRSEIHREEIDLSKMAQSIGQALRNGQPERDVKFIIAPGVSAQGDRRLLNVALENLLENAFKFTSRRQGAVIEFGANSQEAGPEYYVRDNGAGFDMAYSNKLFGPFQRLHSTEEFPGTGIGLATVQRIVHRHGGSVRAEGAVDQGATFYFTLG